MKNAHKPPSESQGEEEPSLEEGISSQALNDMEQLRHEARDYKEKYLRSLADLENARKRLQKERQDIMHYAMEQVICDLLHPIDTLENALKFANQGSSEIQNWACGFEMILTQFRDALANHGVHSFRSEGTHFDPNLHEAVEILESDAYPEGTVVEEFLKGYKLGEKTLRPARVKVAKCDSKGEKETQ